MKISVSVESTSSGLADVKNVELLDLMRSIEGIETNPSVNEVGFSPTRLGALEIVAVIMSSAAAYQLASALRDFVKRQDVSIILRRGEETLEVSAKRGDPKALADVVGFLTDHHEKQSLAVQVDKGNGGSTKMLGQGERTSEDQQLTD